MLDNGVFPFLKQAWEIYHIIQIQHVSKAVNVSATKNTIQDHVTINKEKRHWLRLEVKQAQKS